MLLGNALLELGSDLVCAITLAGGFGLDQIFDTSNFHVFGRLEHIQLDLKLFSAPRPLVPLEDSLIKLTIKLINMLRVPLLLSLELALVASKSTFEFCQLTVE